jgi:hypothetical protein
MLGRVTGRDDRESRQGTSDDGAGRSREAPMSFGELTMIDVKEVLRRWAAGQSARQMSREGVVSRRAATRYIDAAKSLGLDPTAEPRARECRGRPIFGRLWRAAGSAKSTRFFTGRSEARKGMRREDRQEQVGEPEQSTSRVRAGPTLGGSPPPGSPSLRSVGRPTRRSVGGRVSGPGDRVRQRRTPKSLLRLASALFIFLCALSLAGHLHAKEELRERSTCPFAGPKQRARA